MSDLNMASDSLNFDALWWDEIAGPSRFIADIESALTAGHSVICEISTSLSYRWFFRDNIGHWAASSLSVSTSYVECDDYNGEDIDAYLIKKLNLSCYTDYLRRRIPQYLKKKGCLDGQFICIRGVPTEYQRDWMQYISSYRSSDSKHGIFMMEILNASVQKPRSMQNLRFFTVSDYISPDDLRLYASIIAEHLLQESATVRQYAVELITNICQTDAELATDMLQYPPCYQSDTVQALQDIFESNYRDSPRGQEPWHPFALLRSENPSLLKHRIWEAQVRVGFPRIELDRQMFIQNRHSELQDALSVPFKDRKSGEALYFHDYEYNRITNPFDLEVGMLVRMLSLERCNESGYLLYLPDAVDVKKRLNLLRECRNHLAHLEICSGKEFYELISAPGLS